MIRGEQIIAHRGASGYAPENTLEAFRLAKTLGSHWIEFDVKLSKDQQAFIFHDEHLERTTNGVGLFKDASSDYLQTLDCGRWFSKECEGYKIPTFSSVLEWLQEANMGAHIEIKPCPGTVQETAIAVLNHLHRYWKNPQSMFIVSSFEWDALRLCRSISPDMRLGLLVDEWQNDVFNVARELNCESIHINQRTATAERIREIKQHQYKVYVYTVNRKFLATRLLNMGVDAVFSNYPDLFKSTWWQRWTKKMR